MISIFDETNGKYYIILHDLISECVENGVVPEKRAREIINRNAFSPETEWIIIDNIKQGMWSVLEFDEDLGGIITPFVKKPARVPLSVVEKSWMASLLDDPKAKLFDIDRKGLRDVTPLFGNEDYRVFDRVSDPDPYEDEAYQKKFRLICDAISRGLAISVTYKSQTGELLEVRVIPKFLEYSDKDDKFRVITVDGEMQRTINLGRILSCNYCSGQIVKDYSAEVFQEKRICGLELTDVHKALERAAIHFSHYRKTRISRTGEDSYYLEFEYDADLESELVMKIIEFGNAVIAVKPDSVTEKIRKRLSMQDIELL